MYIVLYCNMDIHVTLLYMGIHVTLQNYIHELNFTNLFFFGIDSGVGRKKKTL